MTLSFKAHLPDVVSNVTNRRTKIKFAYYSLSEKITVVICLNKDHKFKGSTLDLKIAVSKIKTLKSSSFNHLDISTAETGKFLINKTHNYEISLNYL